MPLDQSQNVRCVKQKENRPEDRPLWDTANEQNELQGLHYSSHHSLHGTHFSNFTGFLSNGGYSLSWLPLPTKSYAPVLRHICLNTSIPMFLLAPCDHDPPLTCTTYKLAYNVRPSTIFILVHAHISAPTVCNCLLSTLCLSRTLNTFRKHLKTNLFQSAFNSPLRLVQHL